MSTPNAEEQAVNCPKCGAQVGTTPDGKSMRARRGSALQGKAAVAHLTEGVLVQEVEGHGPLMVGCLSCGEEFTVAEALNSQGTS